MTEELVSFEDLIIDVMVLPNGEYFILDEDELPESLVQVCSTGTKFINGFY